MVKALFLWVGPTNGWRFAGLAQTAFELWKGDWANERNHIETYGPNSYYMIDLPKIDHENGDVIAGVRLPRREAQIARMLLAGDRVPAIASKLFISQSTVRNHLAAVFGKFEVRSQQELIDKMRDIGV